MDAEETGVVGIVRDSILALLRGEQPSTIEIPSGQESELQELCQALNKLVVAFGETSEFAQALARGELKTEGPVGNLLASPFKGLHSTLRHLTWQIEQISKGHVGQQVDFLGDFSRAFNAMLGSMREKKRAQEGLRESESTLQTVLGTAPIGIGLARDRVMGWSNEAMSRITGYSQEEVYGQSDRMLYENDEEIERVGCERRIQFIRYSKLTTETRWKRKDGRMIDILLTSSPMPSKEKEGEVVFAVVDITELKKAQKTIENQMLFLEDLIEAIPSPVFYKNPSGVYLGCNTSFAEFLAVPKERIIGSSALDVAPHEQAEIYEQKDRELLSNRGVQTYETVVRKPDGKKTHLIVHKATFKGQDGKLGGVIGIMLDITKRKKAEKALEESEKRYRSLVENAAEGILVVQNSRFVFANRRCAELVGMSELEILDTKFEDLVYPSDRDIVSRLDVNEMRDHGAPSSYSIRLRTRTGIVRWVQINLALVSWRGRPALLGLVTDISERKMSEAKQKDLVEEIKQFAYIVSHDLRSPLTNLVGFSEELRDGIGILKPVVERFLPQLPADERSRVESALGEDIPEALHFMHSAVSRMNRLIESILELSRLGRRDLHLEEVDVNALIEEVLNSFAHEIATGHVKVSVDPLHSVIADRLSLEQIISNLIDNAIKYRDRSRVQEITVTSHRYPHETVFVIEDTGLGIDQSDLTGVFEIFQRRSGTDDVPGEGMGLAFVRALVRRHGGHIWCLSNVGIGSSFSFSISSHLSEIEEIF